MRCAKWFLVAFCLAMIRAWGLMSVAWMVAWGKVWARPRAIAPLPVPKSAQ